MSAALVPSKAPALTVGAAPKKSMVVRFEVPLKVREPKDGTVLGQAKTTEVSPVAFQNVSAPTLVTLEGTVIVARFGTP